MAIMKYRANRNAKRLAAAVAMMAQFCNKWISVFTSTINTFWLVVPSYLLKVLNAAFLGWKFLY
jgi:hypothetical protein